MADDDKTRPVDPDASTMDLGKPSSVALPKKIGHYSIKRIIASGGMGTVYLAQQEQPRRVVALKVMKSGLASKSALRRFEYESQTLARLKHPNIAQVFEAGTHDDGEGGVPFFAMEYIPNARSIIEYAQVNKLSTNARLKIFIKVCDAVHHGHQKGIIHRDLKPGNIIVDAGGEPKIIDFGLARATDSDMTITTLQTDVGRLLGTLQYMSPEQCDADPHDLDMRSDVYALGVVLYELLTESLPYDLSDIALHEAVRIIKEESPARPSTINRNFSGDVETITLKALEKSRERRYETVRELQSEINRFLNHEPIMARPPDIIYQLRMMARRYKQAVIGILISITLFIYPAALLLSSSGITSKSLGVLVIALTWIIGVPITATCLVVAVYLIMNEWLPFGISIRIVVWQLVAALVIPMALLITRFINPPLYLELILDLVFPLGVCYLQILLIRYNLKCTRAQASKVFMATGGISFLILAVLIGITAYVSILIRAME